MAKQLAEGRAFPMFLYGSNYGFAVEAWMAALSFCLLGVSAMGPESGSRRPRFIGF